MKLTKVLSIVMVVALAFSAMALTISAKGDLVLEIGAAELEEFANEPSGGTANLQNSGSGERACNDTGLLIFNRTNDYDAIDLKAENLPDGKYIVEAEVSAETACIFRLAIGDSPYGSMLDSAAETNGETLSIELEVKGGKWQTVLLDGTESEQDRIRIQTSDAVIDNYYVKSIKVFNAEGSASKDGAVGGGSKDGIDEKAEGDKPTDTGVEGVAAIAGLAVIATGAVIISRKRK